MGRIRYSKAPIIEATISFGIVPPAGLAVGDLAAIREMILDQYPSMGKQYFYAGEVHVPNLGKPPEHDVHEHTGYNFSSGDEKQVFSAQLDSFDFSIRQPYDRWEPFRDEARQLWKLFKDVSGVEKVSRVAVRYINRIDIPDSPVARLEDYLRIYPEIPDNWPSGDTLYSFFMQLQLWQQDLDCMLIVNEAPGRPPSENTVSIRLDFDLFRERYDDPWQTEDDSEIWTFLEKLHERKNEVFEASITDQTRRLIK
jgi:uncharacterized protein (TIGR04255 family)